MNIRYVRKEKKKTSPNGASVPTNTPGKEDNPLSYPFPEIYEYFLYTPAQGTAGSASWPSGRARSPVCPCR